MSKVAAKAARSRAQRASTPLNPGQLAFSRKHRYDPQPPTQREAAPALPALNPSERAQELAEERRFVVGWRKRRHTEKA